MGGKDDAISFRAGQDQLALGQGQDREDRAGKSSPGGAITGGGHNSSTSTASIPTPC